jgi:hypothetical protein
LRESAQGGEDLEAVHVGDVDGQDHQVDTPLVQRAQTRAAAALRHDLEARARQPIAQQVHQVFVVVDA